MEKTIYNTYVVMESQSKCDRMKNICLDNNLPISKNASSFELIGINNNFRYSIFCKCFMVLSEKYNMIKITEEEFINLLSQSSE
jgi:hypothetical protein